MNKKYLLILFAFILILPVTASSETVTLYQGQSRTLDSWTITLAAVTGNNSVRIRFEDGLYHEINNNGTIEGLYIKVIDSVYDPGFKSSVAELYLRTIWENECTLNSDCNDSNTCTIDFCVGNQERECQYFNITECKDNDNCCPAGCRYEKDNDCPDYECYNNSMCNDSIVETKDYCKEYICFHEIITECINHDNTCPNGCFLTHNKEDPLQDLDCHPDNKCIKHTNCNDGNDSTSDYCYAFPSIKIKECIFVSNITEIKNIEELTVKAKGEKVEIKEDFDKKCYLKGDTTRNNAVPYFCNGYVWTLQKAESVPCVENYECISGKCIDSRCQEELKSISNKITGTWLKYLVIGIVGFILLVYAIFYFTVLKKLKTKK